MDFIYRHYTPSQAQARIAELQRKMNDLQKLSEEEREELNELIEVFVERNTDFVLFDI
jgi:hypothetical protein